MTKRFVLLFAILMTVYGCSKKEPFEYKIGVITPLTGEGATYGDATKKGAELAVDEINQGNGIKGEKIKLIFEDDQMSPVAGTNSIQKLINVDKVPVILGAFGSSITLAIAPIAEKNKVVLFSASSTADAIKDAGDYIFRNVPPNSGQGKSAAEFALNKLNAKNAAILLMNNDYGHSLSKSFVEVFTNHGGAIVISEQYNPGEKDFRSQLAKIKTKNPDMIFYPGHYVESSIILRQAKEIGIKSKFIGGDGSYSPELIANAGNAAEGSYYTLMAIGYGVTDSIIFKFNESFKKKYNVDPDVYAAYAYDAIKILANAISIGGYSSDGIKKSLYETKNYKGVTGITSFDVNGEVDKPFYVYEVKNGKFELFH